MQSEQINELAKALAKAQGEMRAASKGKTNPFHKSFYADLSDLWDACRDPLSNNGLSVMQTCEGTHTEMYMVTTLAHESGQWMQGKMPMVAIKTDPQSIGSLVTYYRRYCLGSIIGLTACKDDDGEKAMDRITKKELAELEKVLNECDPVYTQKVILHLKKLGFDSFASITQELYPSVMAAAIKNKEETLQKKMTQGIEEKKELSNENTNS